jgi:sulfoxide reductase heme-binding subunit YedZ
MTGLFAFFYAFLHFAIFIAVDNFFDLDELVEDIFERPFVTVGFTAWIILLALALTSTRGWIRRLGGKRWQALHRLVYVGAIAAVVHFLWARKLVEAAPVIYTSTAILVLGFRLLAWYRPQIVSRGPR